MKTPHEYARLAWAKLSLGNIATPAVDYKETGAVARPANFEAVVKELEPFFVEAVAEARAATEHHIKERLLADIERDQLRERVTKLEESIKWFLSLAREVQVGDTPEQAKWIIPEWEMQKLGEALKR